ncbi:MAG TPA: di-heme oxidoredictase family protein [Opitutaceae bacterium]|nr:di-heme oxidoredictase family protein [Opitutaceae bacterium]
MRRRLPLLLSASAFLALALPAWPVTMDQLGQEKGVPVHLQDGQELTLSPPQLVSFGQQLFNAIWTTQDGAGRPLSNGLAGGPEIADLNHPLVFPRNINRISGPEGNSCVECHNTPRSGGGGGPSAVVFVGANRFDFATFSRTDAVPNSGAVDSQGNPVTMQNIGDVRKSVGMFGSGFVEMLARQITADLQAQRDATPPGGSANLTSKGILFGTLIHRADGTWDCSQVAGLPEQSVATAGAASPPSLIICPLHQSCTTVSLRQFTNDAFMAHIGIQPEERVGLGVDQDGDGFVNELTRADVTACTIFQATLPVPGRVMPSDPVVAMAASNGEMKFNQIGCATCHVPSLPLTDRGWIYTEPSPYNPAGNLRLSDHVPTVSVDLTSPDLPQPRLSAVNGVVNVPAYTDFKLHDITSGPDDPNREPLDTNAAPNSPAFFAGNSRFLTRRLWGIANQHTFGHHGQYSTMRQAIEAHAGEAQAVTNAFKALSKYDQDSIIEFLKTLQILPAGTPSTVTFADAASPSAGR